MTKKEQKARERLNRLMRMTAEAVRRRDVMKCHAHFSHETNSKLGTIDSFNIMPGYTCSMEACEHCGIEGCYAIKNVLRFGYDEEKSTVLHAWMENTILAVKNPRKLEREIKKYLDNYKGDFFRIHAGGDFVTLKYARMWVRIARKYPQIQFLAFTKQWEILRQLTGRKVKNFHIVPSGWNGCPVPEDITEDFYCSHCVENGQEPPEGAIQCPGSCDTCNACWMLDKLGCDVWFRKH